MVFGFVENMLRIISIRTAALIDSLFDSMMRVMLIVLDVHRIVFPVRFSSTGYACRSARL